MCPAKSPKNEKKPIFGQMTLNGQMALDWLKAGLVIVASTIQIGTAASFSRDWNIPEWANGWCAIITPKEIFKNPVLITQGGVLRWLENQCVLWDGTRGTASLQVVGQEQIAVLDFDDQCPEIKFDRAGKGQFDPYTPEVKKWD